MHKDVFVIDAIAHAYNNDRSNAARDMEAFEAAAYAWHTYWNPPGVHVSASQFFTDVSAELMARTLFLESDTDIAVSHHLPLYSWYRDGYVGVNKNVEMMERWPDRFIVYAGVDPTAGVDEAIRSLEDQVHRIPGTVGLKMYPAQIGPWRWVRMDDEKKMFPILERAQELGLKSVAIHKAIPIGAVPMEPYKVDDLDGAAFAFPDLNFELVHGGFAFVEESVSVVANMPNVYCNMECTTALAYQAPGLFAEIIAKFVFAGAAGKLCYSSTAMILHPQHQIEAIYDLMLPEVILEKYGIDQLTPEMRAGILGSNYARLVGLDIDARQNAIAGDEFDRMRAERGTLAAPWSHWREGSPAE